MRGRPSCRRRSFSPRSIGCGSKAGRPEISASRSNPFLPPSRRPPVLQRASSSARSILPAQRPVCSRRPKSSKQWTGKRCTRRITGDARAARVKAGDTLTLRVRGAESMREVRVTAGPLAASAEPGRGPVAGTAIAVGSVRRRGSVVGAASVTRRTRGTARGRCHHLRGGAAIADGLAGHAGMVVSPCRRLVARRRHPRRRALRHCDRQMTSWSASALMLLVGICAGPVRPQPVVSVRGAPARSGDRDGARDARVFSSALALPRVPPS